MLDDVAVADWQAGETHRGRMIGCSSLMLLSDTLAASSKPSCARSHNDLRHFICHIWAALCEENVPLWPIVMPDA